MKIKPIVLMLLLALSMIPVFTTTALTPITPGTTGITSTYPVTETMPQILPGTPGASVELHVDVGTGDPTLATEAWITVELYDIDWVDEGDLYVNTVNGPIDLPLTGNMLTDTFDINIPTGWLGSGINTFEFKYAMPTSSVGYTVNDLKLKLNLGGDELVEWYPGGWEDYLTMKDNPEWLKLYTNTYVHSNTTIIIQGKDTYGQNIEAKVVIPPGTGASQLFIFNDTHTDPPEPVTFSEITGILQQNGTHCNSFQIHAEPYPFQQYLGEYIPDGLDPQFSRGWTPNYDLPQGDDTTPIPQDVPVEPANPDPIKIVMRWDDADGDLFPDDDEIGEAMFETDIFIEGLDEHGNKQVVKVHINVGDGIVEVDYSPCISWRTICKVWGGVEGEEYYIFTHPWPQRLLFTYRLRIHHMTIHPDSYDILAYPDEIDGYYPGVTNITVALRDIDGNLLHWGDPNPANYIVVNFASTGGVIQPSNDVRIQLCEITAKANLTADTNARTVRVSASANVPAILGKCPSMNLFAWTEITFDGINSVLYDDVLLHAMQWGYETHYYNEATGLWDILTASYTGPVPPKPWLPPELGGPEHDGRKLDGPIYEVMIPLYVGCNLISSPIHPMLGTYFHTGFDETGGDGKGIPMYKLFNYTSARDCIEIIWWYNGTDWNNYIPGVTGDTGAYFRDGVGYWIKAEKACTLELSGVLMENAPFMPPTYRVDGGDWNLMGFTSAVPLKTEDYLESLAVGDMKFYGPIWTYDAKNGMWTRNPDMFYPGQGFWMFEKDYDDFDPVLAP